MYERTEAYDESSFLEEQRAGLVLTGEMRQQITGDPLFELRHIGPYLEKGTSTGRLRTLRQARVEGKRPGEGSDAPEGSTAPVRGIAGEAPDLSEEQLRASLEAFEEMKYGPGKGL
jgi:hypothetical protein